MIVLSERRLLRRATTEHGVILPLIAFVSLGVITLLIVLGIDTALVKYSAVQLRAEADQACAAVVTELPSDTGGSIQRFFNEISAFEATISPGQMTLTRANMTIPALTASTAGSHPFPIDFTQTEQGNATTTFPPFSATATTNARDVCSAFPGYCSTPGWCSQNPSPCTFQGSVSFDALDGDGVSMGQKYPVSIFSNLFDAGSVVVCELRATVHTFLSQDKTIEASSVFWRSARGTGSYAATSPTSPIVFDWASTPMLPAPGLSIGVATEMTTAFGESRFMLAPGGALQPLLGGTTADYNPLAYSGFQTSSLNHPGPSGFPVQVIPTPGSSNAFEAQVACVNPATLVRNAYLTTIVELASRHGQFRNATEIFHINPQHRGLTQVGPSEARSTQAINPPAIMVPFGSDLASPAFQLPYVTYFGGLTNNISPLVDADIPARFGVPTGEGDHLVDGFINPFNAATTNSASWNLGASDSGLSQETVEMHSYLASQLRNCYHLYSPSPSGIKRFDRLGISQYYNSDFEPPSYRLISNPRPDAYPGGSVDSWDQDCPWGSMPWSFPWNPLSLACSPNSGHSGYLTASELVGVLGTTQACPYQMPHGLTTYGGPGTKCVKPANTWDPLGTGPATWNVATYDLRPDLFAALRYLQGSSAAPLPAVPPSTELAEPKAIKPPGAFLYQFGSTPPDQWSGLTSTSAPFGIGNYASSYLKSSTVLLITHQRLNNETALACQNCNCSAPYPTETCRITCMFNPPPPNPPTFPLTTVDPVTGQTVKRQVIIVYIPTTSLDAKFEAVQNLACAFGATQERTNFDKPFLEVFAPTDPDFLSLEPSCVTMSSANEATCFYKYWQYLLNGPPVGSTVSPEYNIVKFAERDFKERLTKTSIKY